TVLAHHVAGVRETGALEPERTALDQALGGGQARRAAAIADVAVAHGGQHRRQRQHENHERAPHSNSPAMRASGTRRRKRQRLASMRGVSRRASSSVLSTVPAAASAPFLARLAEKVNAISRAIPRTI